jgi:hypothetical protein
MLRYFSPAFRLFFRDKVVRWSGTLSLVLIILQLFILLAFFPRGSNIPLHYNVAFGIDYVGSWYQTLWLPSLALLFSIWNCLVGFWVWRRDRVLSYFVIIASSYLCLILFVAVLLITFLSRTYAQ